MKRYQAIVRPFGIPQEWVLSHLDGKDHNERSIEICTYLKEMGVEHFTVIHYAPIVLNSVVVEDICLN